MTSELNSLPVKKDTPVEALAKTLLIRWNLIKEGKKNNLK